MFKDFKICLKTSCQVSAFRSVGLLVYGYFLKQTEVALNDLFLWTLEVFFIFTCKYFQPFCCYLETFPFTVEFQLKIILQLAFIAKFDFALSHEIYFIPFFSSNSRRSDPICWSKTNMGLHLRSQDFLELY